MIKDIGAKVKVEEIRRLKGNEEERMEMTWVRLGTEKKSYKEEEEAGGRKEKIVEDLTWKEKR